MNPFRYEQAIDARDAVATLAGAPTAAFIAGGTNIVDHMRLGIASPTLLIDVRRATSDRVEPLATGGVRIGAAVRNSDLAANRLIRQRYPLLSRAILSGASAQIRNLATAGGNLLQRTRCVYFQDLTTPCNKREPGTSCSALGGYQRDAAILGVSSSCVATHPSDMAVALVALDAVVLTRGPRGDRAIALADLYRLPDEHPEQDTVLDYGELIVAIDLPPLAFGATSHYRKVRDRASYTFALVSLAAAIDVDQGLVRDVRLALGGVAHSPWRARTAETLLRGAPATEQRFRAAAEEELAAARPLSGNAFKVSLARNLIVRTLLDLTARR